MTGTKWGTREPQGDPRRVNCLRLLWNSWCPGWESNPAGVLYPRKLLSFNAAVVATTAGAAVPRYSFGTHTPPETRALPIILGRASCNAICNRLRRLWIEPSASFRPCRLLIPRSDKTDKNGRNAEVMYTAGTRSRV